MGLCRRLSSLRQRFGWARFDVNRRSLSSAAGWTACGTMLMMKACSVFFCPRHWMLLEIVQRPSHIARKQVGHDSADTLPDENPLNYGVLTGGRQRIGRNLPSSHPHTVGKVIQREACLRRLLELEDQLFRQFRPVAFA